MSKRTLIIVAILLFGCADENSNQSVGYRKYGGRHSGFAVEKITFEGRDYLVVRRNGTGGIGICPVPERVAKSK